MKRLAYLMLAAVCVGMTFSISCGRSAPQPASEDPALFEPRAAQPRLKTLNLWVDQKSLTTEIARTSIELQTGMMYRTNMPENEAMLFVFSQPDEQGFWMKHTFVPLSLAYIDPEGVVREIHDLKPQDTNTVYSQSRRIQYVLEVNQGWFSRNNIKAGAVVKTEKGSLDDSFQRR